MFGKGVNESGRKVQGVKVKCQVKSSKLEEVEVKSSSLVNNEVESSSQSGKAKVVRKERCLCGNEVESTGREGVANLVKLFEHVNKSGFPNFKCCRIPVSAKNLNIEVWRKNLSNYYDKMVCDLLEFGFPIDFDRSKVVSCNERRNHKGARSYPLFINKYLERECNAGRIAGPFAKNPLSLVVSPMNTVPKDSVDERRVIVDLSWPVGASVNDGISKEVYLGEVIQLHYASVEQVCQMVMEVGAGAVIYKRDLRHAYRQIPVDPRDYCYLGYYWEDMFYFDTVLAMGQRNAAMACSRTTDAIMYMHQQRGHRGTNYLDDLIGVSAVGDGWEAYNSLGELLYDLGLIENLVKACPPSTIQLVLGILINTIDGTLSVPEERMEEIILLVGEWQDKVRTTKVELQSLIGKLQFVTKCVLQSRVFMNRLLETLRSMSSKKSVRLSKSFKKDLRWWGMFIEQYNGVSYIPSFVWAEPDVTFATDSCMVGCGGISAGQYFHTSFPDEIAEQDLPIHRLEMLAVLVAVRLWGVYCEGMKVSIYCDNESVVQVINSSKTKDAFLATCLRELWLEVATYGFQLRAIHLPGEENRVADWLSRWECGPEYRELFYGFIAEDYNNYTEIAVGPELFKFSGEL